jgi:hypothetical protein
VRTEGDHLGLRLEELLGLQHHAKLAVRRELLPLTVRHSAACTRTAFCRPMAAADRAQCDAQFMPRVRQRTSKSAV